METEASADAHQTTMDNNRIDNDEEDDNISDDNVNENQGTMPSPPTTNRSRRRRARRRRRRQSSQIDEASLQPDMTNAATTAAAATMADDNDNENPEGHERGGISGTHVTGTVATAATAAPAVVVRGRGELSRSSRPRSANFFQSSNTDPPPRPFVGARSGSVPMDTESLAGSRVALAQQGQSSVARVGGSAVTSWQTLAAQQQETILSLADRLSECKRLLREKEVENQLLKEQLATMAKRLKLTEQTTDDSFPFVPDDRPSSSLVASNTTVSTAYNTERRRLDAPSSSESSSIEDREHTRNKKERSESKIPSVNRSKDHDNIPDEELDRTTKAE